MNAQEEADRLSPKPRLIEYTKSVVENNIKHISTVTELTEIMGYSRCYFSTRVKEIFDMTPSEIIRNKKFQLIKKKSKSTPMSQSMLSLKE
jgi:methylphosphotriester-DNA--protein-cysteine methyltransferase